MVELIDNLFANKEKDWSSVMKSLNESEKDLIGYIRSENPICDSTAADFLFNLDSTFYGYRKLKLSLRKKLLARLSRFSPIAHSSSPFQKAYYSANQEMAGLKILIGLGKNSTAFYVASLLYKKAKRYDLVEIVVEVARYLSIYYSNHDPDEKKARQFHQDTVYYNEILGLEIQRQWHYSELSVLFTRRKGDNDKVYQKARSLVHKILPIKKNVPSFKYYLYSYLVLIIEKESKGCYREALTVAQKALRHFEKLDYDHVSAKSIFLRNMSAFHLQLENYVEADQVISKSLQIIRKGSMNWFVSMEMLLRLKMKLKDYSLGLDVFEKVVKHDSFLTQADRVIDRWMLYKAYLDFLTLIGRVECDKIPTSYSINKFVREETDFDNDYRGMKIPLLIAQLLYFIVDRNYDAMEDRIYSLHTYCGKYLVKSSSNYRSNCFIKMLLLIPVNNFHPVAIKRKASRFVTKLHEKPLRLSDQPEEVEFIPYEQLWDIVLEYLQSPKRKRSTHTLSKGISLRTA